VTARAHHASSLPAAAADGLDGDGGADGLDGDEDEVAVLGVRVLVSDLFLLDMLPRCRDAVQFLSR
jgi:hypothetical protein